MKKSAANPKSAKMAAQLTPKDERNELMDSMREFAMSKQISNEDFMQIMEEVFRFMVKKKYGTDENFQFIVNPDKGDIQAFREREIVEDGEVEDGSLQIAISDALKVDSDYTTGEFFPEEIDLRELGRRLVLTAKQTLNTKIKDLERAQILKQYKDLEGTIVNGEVYQVWRNEMLVLHDNNELILPKTEQIPKDHFKKGDMIKAVIKEVVLKQNANTPRIIISRTDPLFLERLFEEEVPEIADGLITVKKVVRDPGERAKVAVESYDDRIDPVGACVGVKGSRIHGIIKELRGENIDVINYSSNPAIFISRALAPAKISTIKVDEKKKRANVYMQSDQISMAIGKGGQNIKLAIALTAYEIDVYSEVDPNEEDVDLDEFRDEIDDWIIDSLREIGLDSAKSVLKLTIDELAHRTDLDRETLHDVFAILKSEFEN